MCQGISRRLCDGGAVVARQHWEYVIQLSEGNAERLFIQKSSHLSLLRNLILHKGYGETSALMHRFREMAANADIIWVDGSLLRRHSQEAARLGKKVVCFYHNIEANYYGAKADLARNPADRLMAYFAKSNERKSTRFATTRLLLNERDNAELQRIYGVKADFIQPLLQGRPQRKNRGENRSGNEALSAFRRIPLFRQRGGR